jgi:hypothetical protein
MNTSANDKTISDAKTTTLKWLDDVVIGLNLCPFAAKPRRQKQIHLDIYPGNENDLISHLVNALEQLDSISASERETTLIVLTQCLQSFDDYNQFLADADWVIERGGWSGIYQVASFHPHYQFAGSHSQAAENLTNRSPFPILHLLREASLEQALEKYPNPDHIPEDNIKRVESLSELEKQRLFPYLLNK